MLWQTVVLGAVLIAFAVVAYLLVARELEQQLDYTMLLRGSEAKKALAEVTGPHNGGIDPFTLPSSPDFAEQPIYVQYVDPDGAVRATSSNLEKPLPVSPATVRQALSGKGIVHESLRLPGKRADVYSARWSRPDAPPAEAPGVLQIAVIEPTTEEKRRLLALGLALFVLVVTAAAARFGWLLVSNALRPVDAMTGAAAAIGNAADFTRRLPVPAQQDELRRLAETFNAMLERLEAAFRTQQQFLADAAHELRTPLTAIRTNLEIWQRGAAHSSAEREAAARAAIRETDRMGRLVADLLFLAREDQERPARREPVALDRLLLDVYSLQRPLAEQVALTLDDFEQVMVEGDPDQLRQLVLNLIDNALRYTPAGGRVTLSLARQGAWATIRVSDTGPGIPPEHLPHLFDRFYRVDDARARHTGGAGLGLAISQQIARAHGGRIEVASEEGRGTTFTVVLPAMNEPGSASL
jgi:heavy metal sensor kinase